MWLIYLILIVFVLLIGFIGFFMANLGDGVKSGRRAVNSINDKTALLNELNVSIAGEPMVTYLSPNSRAHDNDAWFDELKKYSVSTEERGLVLGVSGTGKTSYLVAQLVNWMQSGKSLVATDIKPEIWAVLYENGVFERYGYEWIVINPTDPSALKYNLFDDIDKLDEIDELLYIVVPKEDSDKAVFSDNARKLIKAIMYHLKETTGSISLPAVRDYRYEIGNISDVLQELKESQSRVARNIAIDILDVAGNERFLASIMGAFSDALEFLNNEVIAESVASSDVSLRETLQQSHKAVFLQFSNEDQAKTYKLFGITLSHVLRMLQLSHKDRDDVFIAIDEIINSAPIPDITKKLNVMRSSKMPLFVYLQTLAGLTELYGPNAKELFMSACSLKVCYRVSDLETAETFAKMAGETEVISWSSSTDANGVSQTESVSTDMMAKPEELLQMEANHAVVIYNGQVAKLPMPVHWRDLPMPYRPEYGTVSELFEILEENERLAATA